MNDYLIQKALDRAYKTAEEINKLKPIAKPQALSDIKKKRLIERNYEALAPKTGYCDLDKLIKGFIPGHLYTLTGVENVGKTSIACNFAVRVAFQMKKVLYIALEPENTVIEYIASVYHDKRFDELTEDDLTLEGLPIEILGKEDVATTEELVNIIDSLDRYDLVVVDHVGYFTTSENNWLQQQSNTVKKMVAAAKKKQCAILLIAHLRKRAKSEKKNYIPTSDDIAGSGAFKQDSTEVMIVTREPLTLDKDEVTYADMGKLYVTKTKTGPNGIIGLHFSERKANIISDGEMIERQRYAINS